MNKDELTRTAQAFGEPLGQVALALIEIVQTLKQQPRFDRLSFNRQIEEQIRKMEGIPSLKQSCNPLWAKSSTQTPTARPHSAPRPGTTTPR
jgi:hypothetical protein